MSLFQILSVFAKSPVMAKFYDSPFGSVASSVFGYLYVIVLLPHCFLAFALLKSEKYMPVLWVNKGFLFIVIGAWHLLKGPIKGALLPPRDKEATKKTE